MKVDFSFKEEICIHFFFSLKGQGEGEPVNQQEIGDNEQHGGEEGKSVL